MSATEPIQGLPYPEPTDAPDGPNQIKAVVDAVASKLNTAFASTTARDAAIPTPTEGMEAFTGTGATAVKWLYRSGAWQDITVRPPTAYTPVLTASGGGFAMGTTGAVASGRYVQVGKQVTVWLKLILGTGATAGTGGYSISLPVSASTVLGATPSGLLRIYDSSAGAMGYAIPLVTAALTVGLQYPATWLGALGSVGSAAPWAWAAGDIIDGLVVYEAA